MDNLPTTIKASELAYIYQTHSGMCFLSVDDSTAYCESSDASDEDNYFGSKRVDACLLPTDKIPDSGMMWALDGKLAGSRGEYAGIGHERAMLVYVTVIKD